jgi:hypothetical protein
MAILIKKTMKIERTKRICFVSRLAHLVFGYPQLTAYVDQDRESIWPGSLAIPAR